MSLAYTEAADLQLRALESDPTQDRLVAAIYRSLDFLEAHPGDQECRRRGFADGTKLMLVRGTDFVVLWQPIDNDDQLVTYIGPDF